MRDLFETIPLGDPVAAARRGARPALRKRLYAATGVQAAEGGYVATLDGKPAHTPAGRMLAAPTLALGQEIAAEWEAQREVIDPVTMPLTRLANAVIDGVAENPGPVAAEIQKYLASDLLLYRASGPQAIMRAPSSALGPDPCLGAQYAWGAFQARRRRRSRHPARCGPESRRGRHPERSVATRRCPRDHDAHRLGADRGGPGARCAIRRRGLAGGPCRRGLEYGAMGRGRDGD